MRGRAIVYGVVLALFAGCMRPERAVVADTDPSDWHRAVTLDYTNRTAPATCEAWVFLRITQRFHTDTLTVRITTLTPDSLHAEEYHRLVFRPHPTPSALQRVVEVPYRRGIRLQQCGNYRFTITPTRPMEGVEAVGMKFIEHEH